MGTIRNFVHYETWKNGEFAYLELSIVTSDRARHRIEGVTEVEYKPYKEEYPIKQRKLVFEELRDVMDAGAACKFSIDEPQMYKLSLVVEVFEHGVFMFHGVAK